MSKVLTLRVDDYTYEILKRAAEGEKRTISNYLEFAAINYTLNDLFVSDDEIEEIKYLFPSLRKGIKDAKEGNYKIID